MILTKISGGMGNQMFQYALGRALSLRHRVPFKLDITAFEHVSTNKYSIRHFELSHFSIAGGIATAREIQKMKYPLGKISRYWRGIRARLFKDTNIRFNSKILARRSGYFDGYWQSEEYFKEYADVIRSDFAPKEPMSASAQALAHELVSAALPVSLHIRRGDNAYNADSMKKFGMPSIAYYETGPSLIAQKLGREDLHVYIFSDDIDWVREHLHLHFPVTYVSQEGIADWEEVVLMSRCAHHVIANSTFSWWGAWLNPSPDKVVVAPLHWANVAPREFTDVIPSSWIRA